MSQNGGEKELILGNKQLISLFFIVVALCGVFFAMGYIVRGNSLKGAANLDTSLTAPDGAVRRQQPEPPRETTEAPATEMPPQGSEPPHVATHPAEDTPAAPAATSAVPVEAKPDAPAAPLAGATYVQVVALPLTDAETTVRALREQHLPASIAPSSKENLYRVLVGPYHQTSDVADVKQRLKTLGFSGAIVQKQ